MRTTVLLLCTLVATACGAEPDAADPGAAVLAHLEEIAPLAVVPDSFRVIDTNTAENRVAFRTVWAFEDTSGVWVDTSDVLTATLDAQGERVAAYDGALAAHVVQLLDEDRRRRYEDLLDAVHHIYHAIVEAGWYYAEEGIDPGALRARVEAGDHAMTHPWDISPVRPDEAQVFWLADPADSAAVCALPITDGSGRPQGFEWVQDRQSFTCRGRTPEIYSRTTIPEEVRAIVQAGGVMPAVPPPSARGATHAHD